MNKSKFVEHYKFCLEKLKNPGQVETAKKWLEKSKLSSDLKLDPKEAKKYKCGLCDFAAKLQSTLKKHIKKAHEKTYTLDKLEALQDANTADKATKAHTQEKSDNSTQQSERQIGSGGSSRSKINKERSDGGVVVPKLVRNVNDGSEEGDVGAESMVEDSQPRQVDNEREKRELPTCRVCGVLEKDFHALSEHYYSVSKSSTE